MICVTFFRPALFDYVCELNGNVLPIRFKDGTVIDVLILSVFWKCIKGFKGMWLIFLQ